MKLVNADGAHSTKSDGSRLLTLNQIHSDCRAASFYLAETAVRRRRQERQTQAPILGGGLNLLVNTMKPREGELLPIDANFIIHTLGKFTCTNVLKITRSFTHLEKKTKLPSLKKRFFIHFIRRRTFNTVAIGKFLTVNLYADIRCTVCVADKINE